MTTISWILSPSNVLLFIPQPREGILIDVMQTCGNIPLVERAVVSTGDQLEVVQGPGHAGDLALVSLQCVEGGECYGVVDLDGIL